MMALSKRLPVRRLKPACSFIGSSNSLDDLAVPGELALAVLADGLAIGGDAVLVDLAGTDQFGDDGGHAAGAVIILAQIFAGGLQVDQQRQVIAVLFPVDDGRARCRDGAAMAFRWFGALVEPPMAVLTRDGVLEGLARHDLRRRQVFLHHVDDAAAGLIGHLAALAVGRGDRRHCRAGTCPALRPASSWSWPCPWCCRSRSRAPTMATRSTKPS